MHTYSMAYQTYGYFICLFLPKPMYIYIEFCFYGYSLEINKQTKSFLD